MADTVTVPAVRSRKRGDGVAPLVMITAYDTPTAQAVDAAGVDLILVGDSVANNVLGYEDTLSVTVADMAHHVAAVARAEPRALVVGDMPWMSYHTSIDDAVKNAATLVRAGAGCVKLEGGSRRSDVIRAIVDAEIPVMGHLGLTPQSVHVMGGFKVQAKERDAIEALISDALAVEDAGCFCVVLEGVPDVVGAEVTGALSVPTIGIGAGPGCDGQVLVFHDLVGFGDHKPAKFVRRYADLRTVIVDAVSEWVSDVRGGSFPGDAESYHLPKTAP